MAGASHIFEDGPSLEPDRAFPAAAALADGKILFVGGGSPIPSDTVPVKPISTAEVYDPVTGTSTATGAMNGSRQNHTLTLLADNRVLVVGSSLVKTAEIYDPATNNWTEIAGPTDYTVRHSATRLANGKVLIAGGNHGNLVSTCELFDPATDTFTPTGSLNVPRERHTATLLPDGRVLVAGGYAYAIDGVHGPRTCEIYDPASGTWSRTGNMLCYRVAHRAVLLATGKVLVVGSQEAGLFCELFDPASGQWTVTGELSQPRLNFGLTLLPDGEVIVFGGYSEESGPPLTHSERYNPSSGTWSADAPINHTRRLPEGFVLPDGRLMVAGGVSEYGPNPVEIRVPVLPDWQPTAPMLLGRSKPTLTLLPDGKVLAAGGIGRPDGLKHVMLASCELYDPATNTWSATGAMENPRWAHTATALADGRVLVTGGGTNLAEIYDPETGIWAGAGTSSTTVGYATATRLRSGNVLVAGGSTFWNDPASTAACSIYQVDTGRWVSTGSLAQPRERHSATLLPDGRVLVAGGLNLAPGTSTSVLNCEIFDPSTGKWTISAIPRVQRYDHTAVVLPGEEILLVDGFGSSGARAEGDLLNLADETTGTTSTPLSPPRTHHITAKLANGDIMVASGSTSFPTGSFLAPVSEIYQADTGEWRQIAPLAWPRHEAASVILADGRVLVAGGRSRDNTWEENPPREWNFTPIGEIYDPGLPDLQVSTPQGNLADVDFTGFGRIPAWADKEIQFQVRNSGTADLTNLGITITGNNAADFTVVGDLEKTVAAPGEQLSFTLRFSPASTGAKNATLQISSNDGDPDPFIIPLQGEGFNPAPEISIEHPAKTILKDGGPKKSFGTAKVGKKGMTKTFTIRNTGSAPLKRLKLTLDLPGKKDFTFTPLEKKELAPGTATTFKVTFQPQSKGTRNATLQIGSNDADEKPFRIKLAGMGANPKKSSAHADSEDP